MSAYYKGPALVAGVRNINDRFYTNETAADIVKQFLNMKHPAYGELIISDNWQELTVPGVTSLSKASHKIIELNTKMTYDHSEENGGVRTEIEAKIEFLDNDMGRLANDMIDVLGMSLRGTGKLEPFAYTDPKTNFLEGECLGMKVTDYEFEGIDLIRKERSSFNGIFK
jgi:hypothetical protein